MIATTVLIAVTIVFAVVCVLLRRKNKSFEGMICKFMASFGFIAIAVYGNYLDNGHNLKYFSLICIGLMFGFCGDVFLGIKEIAPTFRKMLVPTGTGYFLIGHIMYQIAFIGLEGLNKYTLIVIPIGIVISIAMIKGFNMKIKKQLAPIFIAYYTLLIWRIVLTAWIVMKDSCAANIMILLGSIMFFISDSCIALLYFTPVKRKNVFVTAELSTYYPAQILTALSVLLR